MKIKYRLFKNKRGIISDRKPKKFDSDVTFCFDTSNDSLTLILKNEEGETLYRSINGGTSLIPIKFLNGNISVTVADLSDSKEQYSCEGIVCQAEDGIVWIMPEGLDIPLEIISAQNQIDILSAELEETRKEIVRLERDFKGYSIL